MKARRTAALLCIFFLLSGITAYGLADSKTLILPSSLTEIECEAFMGASGFTDVRLPDTIVRIDERAFAGSSVTTINLPDSLTFIAEDAFEGSSLVSATATAGTYAFDWANAHNYIGGYRYTIVDDSYAVIDGVKSETAELEIPAYIVHNGVEYPVMAIAANAFRGNESILSVYIPDSVVEIGDSAFEGCIHLKRVKLSEQNRLAVTGNGVFKGCIEMEEFR